MGSKLTVTNLAMQVGDRQLFSGVSFSLASGESLALLGKTGIGKTTLLNGILGFLPLAFGSVEIDGVPIEFGDKEKQRAFRRKFFGVVYQNAELYGPMSAVENVALPLLFSDDKEVRKYAIDRARTLLEELEVESIHIPASQLSGGERQRTSLARALITEPKFILADEPTGNLDDLTKNRVADLLFEKQRRHGFGILFVTHDHELARQADAHAFLTQQGLRDSQASGNGDGHE
ncbi:MULTISPECIES: ABC transporter ATP-binding protein [Actinotignum]|uniref:ABC transporter ATP-binding protein n=2 Tax=Actinomycetaceae TaxID=2049 RepID=UPI00254CB0E5|nr:ATP-binding cassette domain-containing protein [Actinotignum schaalii]MDE1537096.1 ATP-binding cassette domain-containing protein [Actinotignum schaalii]MDK7272301.1 ATP-binding cassette domain-containing protein [Actinotignum schaalii]